MKITKDELLAAKNLMLLTAQNIHKLKRKIKFVENLPARRLPFIVFALVTLQDIELEKQLHDCNYVYEPVNNRTKVNVCKNTKK